MATINELNLLGKKINESKAGYTHEYLAEAISEDDNSREILAKLLTSPQPKWAELMNELDDSLCAYFGIDEVNIPESEKVISGNVAYSRHVEEGTDNLLRTGFK